MLAESPSSPGHVENSQKANRPYRRATTDDARRWADKYRNGTSIIKIAEEEGVDPGTVSLWLHRIGVDLKQGQHRVAQPPLKYSSQFIEFVKSGPATVLNLLEERVWGLQASDQGTKQLTKFCEFIHMHSKGAGVEEIARAIGVHRSTVLEWRNGTDQPYLIGLVNVIINKPARAGWRWMPLHLTSGGNEQSDWIEVPDKLESFDQINAVINQLTPSPGTERHSQMFGLTEEIINKMRPELFAHTLGMLLGDAGKLGGQQIRFTSMRMDLQLTLKEPSNERLGEFVAMSLSSMGIEMDRVADKGPTGATKRAEFPSASFRWASESSPLIAWMFRACLGLDWNERTSLDKVNMEWIFGAPRSFRVRFVQGLADSDGTVKDYVVEIASMPNAEFVTAIVQSLGTRTAHTLFEGGSPMRTCIHISDASALPIFNELVDGYRYQRMMKNPRAKAS